MEETHGNVPPQLLVKIRKGNMDSYPPVLSQFEISVTKEAQGNYGLDSDYQDRKHLWVTKVRSGPLLQYNSTHIEERQLRPMDFVVQANEAKGNADEIIEQFR